MSKIPGDAVAFRFGTYDSAGTNTAATGTPAGVMVRNGVDDVSPTVTVTSIATGDYKATVTIPVSYARGDDIAVKMTATVSGVTATWFPYREVLEFPLFVVGSVITSTSTTSLGISIPGTTWAAADLLGRYVRTAPTTGLPPEEAPIITATLLTSTTFTVTFASGLFTTVPTVGTAITIG